MALVPAVSTSLRSVKAVAATAFVRSSVVLAATRPGTATRVWGTAGATTGLADDLRLQPAWQISVRQFAKRFGDRRGLRAHFMLAIETNLALTVCTMKTLRLATCVVALCAAERAVALSNAECAEVVPQVNRPVAAPELDVARLIREGNAEVAAAARRFEALRSQVPQEPGALTNATQDLRYQLEVCARR